MASEPIVIGGTYYWQLTASKDGSTWDITGATITLSFMNITTSSTKEYTASILVASDGTAYYTNPTATFDAAGRWSRSWRVSQSGVILESQETEFYVYRSLAAL